MLKYRIPQIVTLTLPQIVTLTPDCYVDPLIINKKGEIPKFLLQVILYTLRDSNPGPTD